MKWEEMNHRMIRLKEKIYKKKHEARLAQSVEHETLNLGVVGSSPTLGDLVFSAI